MKKNTTPELNSKWWNTNQPDGLGAAKELEKALSDFESAEAKLKKESNENNLAVCLKALTQVESAAKKNQAESEKLAKTPPKKTKSTPEDYQNTAECLKKVPKVAESARKELESNAKASGSEDEEDDDGAGLLTNENDYQVYLKKTLNKLKQRSMNFAVGLGKKPNEHRYLFHKSKPGKSLIAAIKDGTDLKKFTWGIAGGHEEKPTTLVLALEGPQAPGLKKKTEKLFKHFKPLPFNLIMLMVEGEEAEDLDDPETADEDWRDLKTELYPAIQQAIAAGSPHKDEIIRAMGLADKAAGAKDYAKAIGFYEQIRGWVTSESGTSEPIAEESAIPPPPPPPPPKSGPSADPGAAFKARLAALLPAIQKAIAEKRPEGEQAKLKASEAGVLARKKEFDAAMRLLAEVEKLVQTVGATGTQSTASQEASATIRKGTVEYAKCRLAWDAAKKKVHAELQNLEKAILAEYQGAPAFGELSQKIRKLDEVLEGFAENLNDTLDQAQNAADDPTRAKHHQDAARIIRTFLSRASNDPFIDKLQANPFVALNVKQTLVATLDLLAKKIV